MEELGSVVLGVLPLIVIVVTVVEGLKVYEVIGDNGSIAKAAIGTGLTLGALGLASELYPPAAPYIQKTTFWLVAGVTGGLGYELGGKALLIRIKATVAGVLGVPPEE
jgi:hypothetical protein